MNSAKERFVSIIRLILEKREIIYTRIVLCCVILTALLMYYRAFFGTELTDCAYYVAEAKEVLNGNVPYAYNNSSVGVGFTFILVVIEAIYALFVPDLEGIFLFCKICFVTYKIVVAAFVYLVLQRKRKRAHALLMAGMLIVIDGYMQLFNYNYVPVYNLFLAGCLLYDVIEQDAPNKRLKVAISGGLTAIGCFANPGWSMSLLLFTALILFRVKNRNDRIKLLSFFYGVVLAVVSIVVLIISAKTSVSDLWYGFYRLFINKIPVDSLDSNKTLDSVLDSFRDPLRQVVVTFLLVSTVTFILSKCCIFKNANELDTDQYIVLAITEAMFLHVVDLCYTNIGDSSVINLWGFAAFFYSIVFFVSKSFRKEKIMWYLGVFQIFYAIAAIIKVSVGAGISRFVNAYTVLIPILFILLESKVVLVRLLSTIMTAIVIISYGYIGFHYVYRDADFHNLTTRVESGVYKGNYTTPARARDLPELEDYLNRIIGEKEQ